LGWKARTEFVVEPLELARAIPEEVVGREKIDLGALPRTIAKIREWN